MHKRIYKHLSRELHFQTFWHCWRGGEDRRLVQLKENNEVGLKHFRCEDGTFGCEVQALRNTENTDWCTPLQVSLGESSFPLPHCCHLPSKEGICFSFPASQPSQSTASTHLYRAARHPAKAIAPQECLGFTGHILVWKKSSGVVAQIESMYCSQHLWHCPEYPLRKQHLQTSLQQDLVLQKLHSPLCWSCSHKERIPLCNHHLHKKTSFCSTRPLLVCFTRVQKTGAQCRGWFSNNSSALESEYHVDANSSTFHGSGDAHNQHSQIFI